MQRKTFERALHAWPEWHASIEQSRKVLRFNVKWPINIRRGRINKQHHEIREQAEAELKRLELPTTLLKYWEDCFYSDYRTKDGKSNYRKVTRYLSKRKSLPELPCDHRIVWYEDEDTHDPWLRVEIRLHARFASKELLNYAAEYAYGVVEVYLRSNKIDPHPVCEWLKGGRPPADENLAFECARLKDNEGLTYKEIEIRYNWPLQRDNYGNLSLCSTARNYVKLGQKLIKTYQQ